MMRMEILSLLVKIGKTATFTYDSMDRVYKLYRFRRGNTIRI